MATFEDHVHDLLIVGTGPAGASCALEAVRAGLDLALVGDEPPGGLVPAARRIDNLAGLPGISGRELAERLAAQLAERGVAVRRGRVVALHRAADLFHAELDDGARPVARTICLAAGTVPRAWPPAAGRDVPRDARSWPAELQDVRVVVVGGGEAALDTALTARDRGAHVVVLVRGPAPHGNPALLAEAERLGVELRCGVDVQALGGEAGGWRVELADGSRVEAEQAAVCTGREPRVELAAGLGLRGLEPDVVQPAVPGLFCAGDLIRGRERYVATALGDGQRAALAARAYVGRE